MHVTLLSLRLNRSQAARKVGAKRTVRKIATTVASVPPKKRSNKSRAGGSALLLRQPLHILSCRVAMPFVAFRPLSVVALLHCAAAVDFGHCLNSTVKEAPVPHRLRSRC